MENVRCEYNNCKEVATTRKSWQPPRTKTKEGYELVPNKIVINTCYTCELLIDFKEYGTN